MVKEAVQYLAVIDAPGEGYEIVHVRGSGPAVAVARIEVDESDFPTLRIRTLEPSERHFETLPSAPVQHAVLSSRRTDHPTNFELTVKGQDDGLEITLSGDHRCMAGDRHYRLFWWRAECKLVNGEPVVRGPFLAGDPDS